MKNSEKEWWENFRWFYSSENVLVVGGKNAESNDELLKNHLDSKEIVLHTEDPGSPFFVIKGYAGKKTIKEAGIACASYSQGWKKGLDNMRVEYFVSEQLKKEKRMKDGTWGVSGKVKSMTVKLELAIGVSKDGKVIGGPVDAIEKKADKFVIIHPGGDDKEIVTREVTKRVDGSEAEVVRFIPAGKSHIHKA